MKLTVDFSALVMLGQKMLPDGVAFSLQVAEDYFHPIDVGLAEGIELSIDELDTSRTLLSYQGRQVLLYIRDHSRKYDQVIVDGEKGNKYHISWCRTLEEMRRENSFDRYHATNRLDGLFEIDDGKGRHQDASLKVCRFCLEKLNYKGSVEWKVRQAVFAAFSLDEFFAHYSTCFTHLPKHHAGVINSGYTSDWKIISRRQREKANYTCQQCQVNMSSAKNLCDVHHINRVKYDNSPANLHVLCRDCHRKQPLHDTLYLSMADMRTLQNLRSQQGIIPGRNWESVYALLDLSLAGDVRAMQQQRKPLPDLNVRLMQDAQEIILDAAWPEQKIALSIKPQTVTGWTVFGVGELITHLVNPA